MQNNTPILPRPFRPRSLLVALLMVAGLGWFGAAGASDLVRFELNDGSIIVGKPLSLADGVYRIRTPALGDVEVPASRVLSMVRGDGAGAGPGKVDGDGAFSADIEAIQRQLVGDPGLMQSISALQQDPDVQAVLSDQELMGLILSGNVTALRDHEGFARLMEHPGIRAVLEQFVGSDGGPR